MVRNDDAHGGSFNCYWQANILPLLTQILVPFVTKKICHEIMVQRNETSVPIQRLFFGPGTAT